tara:strand:+ start:6878 stop:7102 length:225 start_codon:yes stop_codon:yes gene_type:complete
MQVKMTSLNTGVILIGVGTVLTAYHTEQLVSEQFKGKKVRGHISLALAGLVTFSIGCNLVANGIHDHLVINQKS